MTYYQENRESRIEYQRKYRAEKKKFKFEPQVKCPSCGSMFQHEKGLEMLTCPQCKFEFPAMKTCNRCHVEQPLANFHRSKQIKSDGHVGKCKMCDSIERKLKAPEICAKNAMARRKKGVVHNHVYQPVKPEGTYRKSCERCSGWIYVDPSEKVAKCPHCEKAYAVSVKFKGVGLYPLEA